MIKRMGLSQSPASATVAANRQQWAVDMMAIDPGDQVLEIGCGRGVAVSLVCPRLASGKITAVDRSAVMIRAAILRNAEHVASRKAQFHAKAIESIDLPAAWFDKIFAVNVSLFWLQTPSGLLTRVKRLLAPTGTLYLINDRPTPAIAAAISDRIAAALTAHGFITARYTRLSRRGSFLTGVAGTRS